ncbi:MAG: SAM-dependent methyltransferase [Clostridia bacterium]|nr:SAM-dependent methyltransferase [Clostridia bacterium]
MLDERLSLAASLYEPCTLGADIGTDHAHLPCHLLHTGVCKHMIAADVSPKALERARDNLTRSGLMHRADVVLADGLNAIDRPCGCISIMGMGGETMAEILRAGRHKLSGAVLVLSAHTDQPLVRQALMDVGFRITQERLCQAAGRYYIIWRAEEGLDAWTPQELRYGRELWLEDSSLLRGYTAHRIHVLTNILAGLMSAAQPDTHEISQIQADLLFYRTKLEVL